MADKPETEASAPAAAEAATDAAATAPVVDAAESDPIEIDPTPAADPALETMSLSDPETTPESQRGADGKFKKASETEAEPAADPAVAAKPVVPPLPDLDAVRARVKAKREAKLAANLDREKIARDAVEADRAARAPVAQPDGVEALRAKAKADPRAALADLINVDEFVDAEIDRRLAEAEGGARADGAAPTVDPVVRKQLADLQARIAERDAKDAARETAEKAERDRIAAAHRETVNRVAIEKTDSVFKSHGDRYETIVALDKVGAVYEEFVDYVNANELSFKSDDEAIPYLLAIADRCEIALDKENERRAATKKFQARFAPRAPASKSTGTVPAKANGAGKKPSGVSARAATGVPINVEEDGLDLDVAKRAAALREFSLSKD